MSEKTKKYAKMTNKAIQEWKTNVAKEKDKQKNKNVNISKKEREEVKTYVLQPLF